MTNTGVYKDGNGSVVPAKNPPPRQRIDGTGAMIEEAPFAANYSRVSANVRAKRLGGVWFKPFEEYREDAALSVGGLRKSFFKGVRFFLVLPVYARFFRVFISRDKSP